jgi:hypothetical protein
VESVSGARGVSIGRRRSCASEPAILSSGFADRLVLLAIRDGAAEVSNGLVGRGKVLIRCNCACGPLLSGLASRRREQGVGRDLTCRCLDRSDGRLPGQEILLGLLNHLLGFIGTVVFLSRIAWSNGSVIEAVEQTTSMTSQ